jgi:MYXO-CTERM domain-containing protein
MMGDGYRTLSPAAAAFGAVWAMAMSLVTVRARADDVLHVGTAQLDRPTLVALGVQLLITGDDNHNASVAVRYRSTGTTAWRQGLPLFRVRPEVVTGRTVPAQFAGSIFDLVPGQSYEIELHAVDVDGSVDQIVMLTSATRSVPPTEPKAPNRKSVTDVATLRAALSAAKAGDVITLADGTYAGTFSIQASGTADNPIVIRGTSQDGTILDGGNCTGCNVLEAYGSFVHIEQLTLTRASRALRFQGTGAERNVVRRVHFKDTTLGIGSNPDQKDFYVCDNVLEGRLVWPAVYTDDNGAHANDDGINLQGSGHVVCHNRLVGYGDALKTEQDGARAIDFYGNEVTSAYDNGLELDGSEGNVRAFRNRFTNTYATLSYQPVFGGPAYTFRNVVVNVANEQMKFHALGTTPPQEPSGMLVYHNTFVSPITALANHTDAVSHHFVLENNLFITAPDPNGRTVDFTGGVDDGTFDYNGYYPDGIYDFTWGSLGYVKYPNLAAARAALGIEMHGLILPAPIFESGLVAPASHKTRLDPVDVTLAASSTAIDRGLLLPNLNDGYRGGAPDMGALERGCPIPIYGVRPAGIDETNEPIGCTSDGADGGIVDSGVPPVDSGAGGNGGARDASGGSGGTGATAGRGGNGGNAGSGAAPAIDGGGAAGAAGTGAGGNASGGASGSGSPSGGGAGTGSSQDQGGCGCATAQNPTGMGAWALALLALAARRRRAT